MDDLRGKEEESHYISGRSLDSQGNNSGSWSQGKNRGPEIHYYSKVTQEHFATESEHQFTHT